MALPHNEWIRHSLVALYVGFYILFKLFFSFFPYNHLDSVCIHIVHFLTPFLITLKFYLLRFTSSLLCSLSSPILFRTNSLLLIIHLSFYINHFAHFPSHPPPPHLLLEHFLSCSRLSWKISLSCTLSLRGSVVILQAECYWRPNKAKARWICQ